jgi:hypothetical protein
MGLDICDNLNEKHTRVGSYSYVHVLRYKMIGWAIVYLKKKLISTELSQKQKQQYNLQKWQVTKRQHMKTDGAVVEDVETAEIDEESVDDEGDDTRLTPSIVRARILSCIHMLETWIVGNSVQYNRISDTIDPKLCFLGLSGLYHFVNSSDCEGCWSNGQCYDIVHMFDNIILLVPDIDRKELCNLKEVFDCAVKNDGYVIKC